MSYYFFGSHLLISRKHCQKLVKHVFEYVRDCNPNSKHSGYLTNKQLFTCAGIKATRLAKSMFCLKLHCNSIDHLPGLFDFKHL